MEPSKRLYRSRYDSVIAGVAGGLARYFNIDPIIFRIVFVVLVLAGASGLLIYIILWIAVPLDPDFSYFKYNQPSVSNPSSFEEAKQDESFEEAKKPDEKPFTFNDRYAPRNEGSMIAGIIFIVLGSVFLFAKLIPSINAGDLWPILLIAAGILVMRSALSKPKTNQ